MPTPKLLHPKLDKIRSRIRFHCFHITILIRLLYHSSILRQFLHVCQFEVIYPNNVLAECYNHCYGMSAFKFSLHLRYTFWVYSQSPLSFYFVKGDPRNFTLDTGTVWLFFCSLLETAPSIKRVSDSIILHFVCSYLRSCIAHELMPSALQLLIQFIEHDVTQKRA